MHYISHSVLRQHEESQPLNSLSSLAAFQHLAFIYFASSSLLHFAFIHLESLSFICGIFIHLASWYSAPLTSGAFIYSPLAFGIDLQLFRDRCSQPTITTLQLALAMVVFTFVYILYEQMLMSKAPTDILPSITTINPIIIPTINPSNIPTNYPSNILTNMTTTETTSEPTYEPTYDPLQPTPSTTHLPIHSLHGTITIQPIVITIVITRNSTKIIPVIVNDSENISCLNEGFFILVYFAKHKRNKQCDCESSDNSKYIQSKIKQPQRNDNSSPENVSILPHNNLDNISNSTPNYKSESALFPDENLPETFCINNETNINVNVENGMDINHNINNHIYNPSFIQSYASCIPSIIRPKIPNSSQIINTNTNNNNYINYKHQ